MTAYDDDADRLAEHITGQCDDPFCQICLEEEAVESEEEDFRERSGHYDPDPAPPRE